MSDISTIIWITVCALFVINAIVTAVRKIRKIKKTKHMNSAEYDRVKKTMEDLLNAQRARAAQQRAFNQGQQRRNAQGQYGNIGGLKFQFNTTPRTIDNTLREKLFNFYKLSKQGDGGG